MITYINKLLFSPVLFAWCKHLVLNVLFLENRHAFSARPIENQYIHVLEKLIDI